MIYGLSLIGLGVLMILGWACKKYNYSKGMEAEAKARWQRDNMARLEVEDREREDERIQRICTNFLTKVGLVEYRTNYATRMGEWHRIKHEEMDKQAGVQSCPTPAKAKTKKRRSR